jgi:superfamily II DNA or RNA helicase
MAINHIVSKKDKDSISSGMGDSQIEVFDLEDFDKLRETLDEYDDHFFRCLAYLIREKRIDIRIIKPKRDLDEGMAHTKNGQFRDDETIVSFTGSANFTVNGFINNKEDIKICLSTCPYPPIQNQINRQKEKFDNLMEGNDDTVIYLDSSKLVSAIESYFGGSEIDELVYAETNLHEYKCNKRKKAEKEAMLSILNNPNPRFPYPSGPRDYQVLAYKNWVSNGQKGLFAMATGTGKTLTALNVLLNIYNQRNYYKAIILAPTATLVEQWEQECRKFNFNRIITIYSKNHKWRENIDDLNFQIAHAKEGAEVSFIIISTYVSFARERTFQLLNSFSKKQTLLIADEAHNMGAGGIIKRLPDINYYRRIGLSATPERQFDSEGNKKLYHFFGSEEKFTYEYSMEEAIRNGVLCRYFYYPHLVSLTEEEMYKYEELSIKISKYFNYNSQQFEKKDDILMNLLLARKRIIHKAENKLNVFKKIITDHYLEKGNLKYTLVYVPEGNKAYDDNSDYFDKEESLGNDIDAEHLIEIYTEEVSNLDSRVTVRKFTGESKDRDIILDGFSTGRIQVLTSMKCLDEGVDVPRSEMAIFCSSTGNPRQFIQRRGRVLRTHPEKKYAYLHDLVVIPRIQNGSPSYKMEQSLLKAELKRVCNFAMLSENSSYSQQELMDVMNYYGLNLFNNEHI